MYLCMILRNVWINLLDKMCKTSMFYTLLPTGLPTLHSQMPYLIAIIKDLKKGLQLRFAFGIKSYG